MNERTPHTGDDIGSGSPNLSTETSGMETTPLQGKKCPICGTTNPAGDNWCFECGFELLASPTPTAAGIGSLILEDGTTFELKAGANRIGRVRTEIMINSPFVSRNHAVLHCEPDGIYIEDLGSTNGTFVDGSRIEPHRKHPLPQTAALVLGKVACKVEMTSTEAWGAVPSAAEEKSIDEEAETETVPEETEGAITQEEISEQAPLAEPSDVTAEAPLLERALSRYTLVNAEERIPPIKLALGETTIGRKPDLNDVAIQDDPYISGKHLLVDVEGETVIVKDLGSTNGSFIDGERIEKEAPVELKPSQKIMIGRTTFELSSGPEQNLM